MIVSTTPTFTESFQGPFCAVCSKQEGLERCSKCLSIFYCSLDHQKADLEKHKLLCGRVCVVCQKPDDKIFQCTRCLVNFCSSECKNVKIFHEACPSIIEERSVRNPQSIISTDAVSTSRPCRALRLRKKTDQTTPTKSNPQTEGFSSSSDVSPKIREQAKETNRLNSPHSTDSSSTSSSSSSPSLDACKDMIKVWKRLDKVLKLESAPDYSHWTHDDRKWKTVGNIFESWVNLKLQADAFKNVGTELNLSGLILTHLPDCLAKLPFRELDLRSNHLKTLPDWIYGPLWYGTLYINASTFGGVLSKYTEFMVRSYAHSKSINECLGENESLHLDMHKIALHPKSSCVEIKKYMVIGRYVFPVLDFNGQLPERVVWIPESFDTKLIEEELGQCCIGILRKKLTAEDSLKMKPYYPLAEAFFTGNPSR